LRNARCGKPLITGAGAFIHGKQPFFTRKELRQGFLQ
jgi:hypothetical protein